MLTRLLLLGALLLGTVTPSSPGAGDHCRLHGAMGGMGHQASQGTLPRSAPPHQDCDHCPPTDCAVVMHCSASPVAATLPAPFLFVALYSFRIAPHTSLHLRGRALEPPIPPPNRSL